MSDVTEKQEIEGGCSHYGWDGQCLFNRYRDSVRFGLVILNEREHSDMSVPPPSLWEFGTCKCSFSGTPCCGARLDGGEELVEKQRTCTGYDKGWPRPTEEVQPKPNWNEEAYERQRPGLEQNHIGRYAGICAARLLRVGPTKETVIERIRQRHPDERVVLYVREIGT